MKTYTVGNEEISERQDGKWEVSWDDGDNAIYDTLSDVIEGLADHEKAEVEAQLDAE